MSKSDRIKEIFRKTATWFVIVILVIAGASSYIAHTYLKSSYSSSSTSMSTTSGTTTSTTITSTTTTSSYTTTQYPNIGQKFVEIKAFDVSSKILQNGQVETVTSYIDGADYTATQLLTLVQNIHSQIGNFNIIRFIRTECYDGIVNPNATASQINGTGYNWNGTLNSYATAIQQAAGGQIIPDAGMTIYYGANAGCDTGNASQQQHEEWFFQESASLLTLTAVADGDRYVMLEAWDTYYAAVKPNQSEVDTFFQTLEAQGWRYFMPQQNGIGSQPVGNYGSCSAPFDEYDYGYAGYFRNGIFWVNTTYPYVFPNFPLVCQIQKSEPYLNGVVVGLETQLMAGNPAYCDGKYDYAGQAFAECLTKSQREVALTNLAENQTKYDYIFIYPIVIGEHSIQYDAQQDGTLGLMEQLINEYN